MFRLAQFLETKNYRTLENKHIKLTADKEFRKTFHAFLVELGKDETRIPTKYDDLEKLYETFSADYNVKAHAAQSQKSR